MKNTVEIKISDDLTLDVNVNPTIEEKIAFIRTVIDGIDIDNIVYQTYVDAKFDVLYVMTFTNYIFPDTVKDDGKVDLCKAYNHIRNLDIRRYLTEHDLYFQLQEDVRQVIEFEKQKAIALYSRNIALEETLDSIDALVNKGIDFLASAMDKLNSFTPDVVSDIVKNIPEQFLSLAEN